MSHAPVLTVGSLAGLALQVVYSELPDGARITYSTSDPALITAIHRWFGA